MTKTQTKNFEQLRWELVNIYENTIRFMWTHEKLLDSLKQIWEDPRYTKLPGYKKSELEGVEWDLRRTMWRSLVFAYLFGDKWLDIGSESYRKHPPSEVHGHVGAYVWKADTQKVFSSRSENDLRRIQQ